MGKRAKFTLMIIGAFMGGGVVTLVLLTAVTSYVMRDPLMEPLGKDVDSIRYEISPREYAEKCVKDNPADFKRDCEGLVVDWTGKIGATFKKGSRREGHVSVSVFSDSNDVTSGHTFHLIPYNDGLFDSMRSGTVIRFRGRVMRFTDEFQRALRCASPAERKVLKYLRDGFRFQKITVYSVEREE